MADRKHFSPSDEPRIVGSDVTAGAEEGGRRAMENILQKADDVTLVYGMNEPAAAGGYEALKAAGKDKSALIVAIDGGCPRGEERRGRHHWGDVPAIPAEGWPPWACRRSPIS